MSRAAVTVQTSGFRELEANLSNLKKATAKNVLKKAIKYAAQPMLEGARHLVAVDTGTLKQSLIFTTKKPKNSDVGKIAYSKELKTGGDRKSALKAMRDARRASPSSFAEGFIVANAVQSRRVSQGQGKKGKRIPFNYGAFVEYGDYNNAPKPFMRPAFDVEKETFIDRVRESLAIEIDKAIKRVAKKAGM